MEEKIYSQTGKKFDLLQKFEIMLMTKNKLNNNAAFALLSSLQGKNKARHLMWKVHRAF